MKHLLFVALSCLALIAGCTREEPQPSNSLPKDAAIDAWLEKMEVSSREFYAAREAVLAAVAPKPGDHVADIGAGTGLYSLLFAHEVGAGGEVYAIDIEPRFLTLINQRAEDLDFGNVAAVLGRPNSITLPAGSIDIAFISDTYNYFTDPAALMASVRSALRPGGRLYILDFHKRDGVGERAHVRLGEDGVRAEILSFGFEGGESVDVPGLKETYMLQFSRP